MPIPTIEQQRPNTKGIKIKISPIFDAKVKKTCKKTRYLV